MELKCVNRPGQHINKRLVETIWRMYKGKVAVADIAKFTGISEPNVYFVVKKYSNEENEEKRREKFNIKRTIFNNIDHYARTKSYKAKYGERKPLLFDARAYVLQQEDLTQEEQEMMYGVLISCIDDANKIFKDDEIAQELLSQNKRKRH